MTSTDISKQVYGLEAVNYSFHEKERQQDMELCGNLTEEGGKQLRNKVAMGRTLPFHSFASYDSIRQVTTGVVSSAVRAPSALLSAFLLHFPSVNLSFAFAPVFPRFLMKSVGFLEVR